MAIAGMVMDTFLVEERARRDLNLCEGRARALRVHIRGFARPLARVVVEHVEKRGEMEG